MGGCVGRASEAAARRLSQAPVAESPTHALLPPPRVPQCTHACARSQHTHSQPPRAHTLSARMSAASSGSGSRETSRHVPPAAATAARRRSVLASPCARARARVCVCVCVCFGWVGVLRHELIPPPPLTKTHAQPAHRGHAAVDDVAAARGVVVGERGFSKVGDRVCEQVWRHIPHLCTRECVCVGAGRGRGGGGNSGGQWGGAIIVMQPPTQPPAPHPAPYNSQRRSPWGDASGTQGLGGGGGGCDAPPGGALLWCPRLAASAPAAGGARPGRRAPTGRAPRTPAPAPLGGCSSELAAGSGLHTHTRARARGKESVLGQACQRARVLREMGRGGRGGGGRTTPPPPPPPPAPPPPPTQTRGRPPPPAHNTPPAQPSPRTHPPTHPSIPPARPINQSINQSPAHLHFWTRGPAPGSARTTPPRRQPPPHPAAAPQGCCAPRRTRAPP